MTHGLRLGSLIVAALTGICLSDCTSWRRQDAPLENLLSEKPGVELHVWVAGAKAPFEVRSPRIAGDTLRGWGRFTHDPNWSPSPSDWEWRYQKRGKRDSLSIPLSSIRSVEARQISAGKTVLLVVGIGATVALVVAIVALSNWEGLGPSGGGGGGDTYGASCPLVYGWDGSAWRLDSGTYAGAIMPALARTDVSVLDHATAEGGALRLRLTGLSGETEHVDAVAIQSADHPRGTFIAPDPGGRIHLLAEHAPPRSARDYRGADALRRIEARDGWCWESSLSGRDPDRDADVRDGIEVEFVKPAGARVAWLVVDGNNTPWAAHMMQRFVGLHGARSQEWYETIAADPRERAALVAGFVRETSLRILLWDGARWVDRGYVPEVGPEVTKRQVVAIDLEGVPGDRIRARMESAAALWDIDRVSLALETGREPVLDDAPLVSGRDEAGRPVESLLRRTGDGREYVIEPGNAAELRFREPPHRAGLTRTFIARTTGWYRIHAADGAEADRELLSRLVHEPLAASRYSVQEMNSALAAMERGARSP